MSEKKKYNITCNTDDNYVQHCCVMLCSLFENNKNATFIVYVLISKLSNINQKAISDLAKRYGNTIVFCPIDESILDGVLFRKNRPLTKSAYYRLLLPSVLPDNIEKILYLDCDMVILDSIDELFDLKLEDYALAACEDIIPYTAQHRKQLNFSMTDKSFCSGMMIINIKYWRDTKAQESLLAYSKYKREPVYLHDQDSLNYVFRNKWFSISKKWNKTPMSIVPLHGDYTFDEIMDFVDRPKIIHYASTLKPWFDVRFPSSKYYRKYLKLSQFPNPKITHLPVSKKIIAYLSCLRFYLNYYIHPFIPNFIEIPLKDIFRYVMCIRYILFPKKFREYRIRLWIEKYNK